jgi:radical SAM protein with 4Fe4S-binding SPASM domain
MDFLKFKQIRIENTNRCNNRCIMCPREKHTRKMGVMSLFDLEFILNQMPLFQNELHLHGYGEPLLDNNFLGKINLTNKIVPKAKIIFFTTLGVNLRNDFFEKLSKQNIDTIVVSMYGFDSESYKKIHRTDNFDLAFNNLKKLVKIRRKSINHFNVKVLISEFEKNIPNSKKNAQEEFLRWFFLEDIDMQVNKSIHNYGLGRNYNAPGKNEICSIVWGNRKNILQITWDLNVIPCCYDFNSDIIWGNLKQQTIDQIFQSKKYLDFISSHKKNDLGKYLPCLNCERCFLP